MKDKGVLAVMKDRTRRRPMSKEERALWEAFTLRLTPLSGKNRKAGEQETAPELEKPEAEPKQPKRRGKDSAVAPAREFAPLPPMPTPKMSKRPPLADFEPRKARQLAAGKLDIEARIDLHGMRQHEAQAELRRFILSCCARGLRFVKVITGKGRQSDDSGVPFDLFDDRQRGVLKRLVPLWLGEPELRAVVVSFTTAGRGHGGEGALYVQLRRKDRVGR